ncbi:hypothetical protein D3C78_1416300 [compost metagenome]
MSFAAHKIQTRHPVRAARHGQTLHRHSENHRSSRWRDRYCDSDAARAPVLAGSRSIRGYRPVRISPGTPTYNRHQPGRSPRGLRFRRRAASCANQQTDTAELCRAFVHPARPAPCTICPRAAILLGRAHGRYSLPAAAKLDPVYRNYRLHFALPGIAMRYDCRHQI